MSTLDWTGLPALCPIYSSISCPKPAPGVVIKGTKKKGLLDMLKTLLTDHELRSRQGMKAIHMHVSISNVCTLV